MKPRVYVETTIPSFYFETRLAPDMLARREWTRQWWEEDRNSYDIVTSEVVLDELRAGHHPHKADALALLHEVNVVPMRAEVPEIVKTYVERLVMPRRTLGDAFHLALASVHGCHFLLTWNCAHLANANKFEHIRHVNTLLGLWVPTITTPFELHTPEKEA